MKTKPYQCSRLFNSGLVSLLFLVILSHPLQAAQKRVALVIGNAAYQGVQKLVNPVNDATDMAAKLEGFGFDVTMVLDGSKREMVNAISAFSAKLNQKKTVGLFYYSGHGVQDNRRNFLIPVANNIKTTADLSYEAVDVGRILENMKLASNNLNLMILDACRNNPLPLSLRSRKEKGIKLIQGGLTTMNVPKGSVVLYATQPGKVALDGEPGRRNGIFTEKLLDVMSQPDLSVYQIFQKTAQAVDTATKSEQTPYLEGTILGDFTFSLNEEDNDNITLPLVQSRQAEILFWDSIKNETNPAYFQQYVKNYPQGLYVELAQLKINSLRPIQAANQASLTIKTSPDNAQVRILNTVAKYQAGMQLKPGPYHIEVTYSGYQRSLQWITLANEETIHAVVLEQTKPIITSTPSNKSKPRLSYEPEMVKIRGGDFQMGSPKTEKGRYNDERLHPVHIDDFWIGKTEVTFAHYDVFAEQTGRKKPKDSGWGRGNRPVIYVSLDDATAYANWLAEQSGRDYRLPTEAEWEYAARAGSTTRYSWGDELGRNRANCYGCGSQWDNKQTAAVASFSANDFNLHDMHGNVREWTCSDYASAYAGHELRCSGKQSAVVPRVVRGGSWFSFGGGTRSAIRDWFTPDYRNDFLGFRLALGR